jgi:uncharacterized DUF497 family protein
MGPEKGKIKFQKTQSLVRGSATALSDPMAATGADPDHSITKERYVTFGVSERGRLLAVAHTEAELTIRIISARIASKGERELYEDE